MDTINTWAIAEAPKAYLDMRRASAPWISFARPKEYRDGIIITLNSSAMKSLGIEREPNAKATLESVTVLVDKPNLLIRVIPGGTSENTLCLSVRSTGKNVRGEILMEDVFNIRNRFSRYVKIPVAPVDELDLSKGLQINLLLAECKASPNINLSTRGRVNQALIVELSEYKKLAGIWRNRLEQGKAKVSDVHYSEDDKMDYPSFSLFKADENLRWSSANTVVKELGAI